MGFKNYQQMINKVQNMPGARRVALVGAEDEHSIEAVFMARRERIVEPILVGQKSKIVALMDKFGFTHTCSIVDIGPEENPAQAAVELLHEGKVDFLMKGKIETAQLLKPVVNKENGLHTGRLMSHVSFLEVPTYHKILIITDGGMVPNPDLQQKMQIIANTVLALHKMGYDLPKIAILAGTEQVNPKMQETADAAELKTLNQKGLLNGCVIEGPISYDLAISRESARIKGYDSPYSGDFDVLLVPMMAAGNILCKALIYNCGAKMAGMVLGAKIPIVVTSRGASTEEKYLSLVLSAAAV